MRRGLVLAFVAALACAPAPEPKKSLDEVAAGRGPLTLVLHEVGGDETIRVDAERAARRFSPCSTFKIPNALIGLEAGAIPFDDTTLHWDPVRDPRPEFRDEIWERDHTLASALQHSIVWYFREVARRVGEERMQAALDRLDYGNRDISGGIDRFWLADSLRISADEQVRFLTRLQQGEFGFEERYLDSVRDALTIEETDRYTWIGKTGTCPLEEGGFVGWLVGGVERDGRVWVYAFNYERPTMSETFRERLPLMRELLVAAGTIPE